MKKNIVILARDCDSTNIVYNFLQKYFTIDAVIFEMPIPRKQQFKKRAKRLGYLAAISQALFFLFIVPVIKMFSGKRKKEIYKQYDLDESPIPEHLVKKIRYINTEEGRELLKKYSPALMIVNGTRIISKKTLEAVPSTFLNIHTGITPLFRGVHGGYWSVAKGRKNLFGTTIHYVDPGVDTGEIIEQVFTEPNKKDNFFTYPYLQYAICLPVLKKVVDAFRSGQPPTTRQPLTTESELWFHPTVFQYLRNIRKTFIIIFFLGALQLFSGLFYNGICHVY